MDESRTRNSEPTQSTTEAPSHKSNELDAGSIKGLGPIEPIISGGEATGDRNNPVMHEATDDEMAQLTTLIEGVAERKFNQMISKLDEHVARISAAQPPPASFGGGGPDEFLTKILSKLLDGVGAEKPPEPDLLAVIGRKMAEKRLMQLLDPEVVP